MKTDIIRNDERLRSFYLIRLYQLVSRLNCLFAKDEQFTSEEIHQTRITIRKLSIRKLNKELKKLCSGLTDARELDVAMSNAKKTCTI